MQSHAPIVTSSQSQPSDDKFMNEMAKLIGLNEASPDGVNEEQQKEFASNLKAMMKEDKELSEEAAEKGSDLIANALMFMITGKMKALPDLAALTEEELKTLDTDVRKILADEKVPAEKHDAFVKFYIEKTQEDIQNLNKLSVEMLESATLDKLQWTEQSLDLIDYKKESEEATRLFSKLQQLPAIHRNIEFAVNKSIMLALQKNALEEQAKIQRERAKAQMQEKMISMFFEALLSGKDEEEATAELEKRFAP